MAAVTIEINPDLDPVIYVFDILFDCRARYIDLLSEEDLKDFGTYRTGMESMDDANTVQMVPCNLSVAAMAVHMSKGFKLIWQHPQDVLKMYEFSQHLLQRWMAELNNHSLNSFNAPLTALSQLDYFSNIVYEQAKFYDEPKLTSIEQRFGTDMSFGSILKMFNKGNKTETERIDTIRGKRRKGFGGLLAEYQMRNDTGPGPDDMDGIFRRGLNDRK